MPSNPNFNDGSLYGAASLNGLLKKWPWTKSVIRTNSDWYWLWLGAKTFPEVSNKRWNCRAYGIEQHFKGCTLVIYLKHLFKIGCKCEICGCALHPVKSVDSADGKSRQQTVLIIFAGFCAPFATPIWEGSEIYFKRS